jgi:1,4-dihydroxy-2-naphthoate octaprenyltransferase
VAAVSPYKAYFFAARPKTLPAAAVPVVLGGTLAQSEGAFSIVPWILCLLFALLIQVGTNYANDYYDFVKGSDDERRIGPSRATASGWVRPSAMRRAMILTFAAAFLIGCGLIPFGGWWLLAVGLVAILCGIAYTGGPYPLGYNGWGDLFVFIFFGWVATALTYYVQAGTFRYGEVCGYWLLLAGALPGVLSTNLLVVNNLRDRPLDAESGKRTLAVRFGRRFALAEYHILNLAAFVCAGLFAFGTGHRGGLLVLGALPLAIRMSRRVQKATTREDFATALAGTAGLLMLAGLLFSGGLLLRRSGL